MTLRSPFNSAAVLDPLDLEIEPGFRVRDLKSKDECTSAILQIDMARGRIKSQIARAEASSEPPPPGWRTRAENAMGWKKRVRRAIVAYSASFDKPDVPNMKRRVILDTIRTEIGDDEFDRIVEIAKLRYPEAFAEDMVGEGVS